MNDITMNIKRSEYLELKRVNTILAREVDALKKENAVLKRNATKNVAKENKKEAK